MNVVRLQILCRLIWSWEIKLFKLLNNNFFLILCTSSHEKYLSKWTPFAVWYSCKGGSTKITSNSQPITSLNEKSAPVLFARQLFRYIGFWGTLVRAISSSFNRISSLSFGYSSNLSFRPGSRIKFCGLCPISTKYWL